MKPAASVAILAVALLATPVIAQATMRLPDRFAYPLSPAGLANT